MRMLSVGAQWKLCSVCSFDSFYNELEGEL